MKKLILIILSLMFLCGCSAVESNKLIQTHTHTVKEWHINVAPTCTYVGEMYGKCAICNQTQVKTVPKKEHNLNGWEIITKATKTTDGFKVRRCLSCGQIVDKEYFKLSEEELKQIEEEERKAEEASKFQPISGKGSANVVVTGLNKNKWYQVHFRFDATNTRSAYVGCRIHNMDIGRYDLAVSEAILSNDNHIYEQTHLISKDILNTTLLFEFMDVDPDVTWTFLIEEIKY